MPKVGRSKIMKVESINYEWVNDKYICFNVFDWLRGKWYFKEKQELERMYGEEWVNDMFSFFFNIYVVPVPQILIPMPSVN